MVKPSSLKITAVVCVVAMFMLFNPASAQNRCTSKSGGQCVSLEPTQYLAVANIENYLGNFYEYLLGFVGIAALAAMVYGGIQYIAYAASPSGASEGKKWIYNGLMGLLLVAFSWVILNTINPDLTKGFLLKNPCKYPGATCKDVGGGGGGGGMKCMLDASNKNIGICASDGTGAVCTGNFECPIGGGGGGGGGGGPVCGDGICDISTEDSACIIGCSYCPADCGGVPTKETDYGPSACVDGNDNDGDGLIDLADLDCSAFIF